MPIPNVASPSGLSGPPRTPVLVPSLLRRLSLAALRRRSLSSPGDKVSSSHRPRTHCIESLTHLNSLTRFLHSGVVGTYPCVGVAGAADPDRGGGMAEPVGHTLAIGELRDNHEFGLLGPFPIPYMSMLICCRSASVTGCPSATPT